MGRLKEQIETNDQVIEHLLDEENDQEPDSPPALKKNRKSE